MLAVEEKIEIYKEIAVIKFQYIYTGGISGFAYSAFIYYVGLFLH